MQLRIDPSIRADHGELRQFVVAGFEGVDATGVVVLVERARGRQDSFTGRAYGQPLRSMRRWPGVRFVVRLRIPATLRNRGYPMTHRYRGRKTAPWITVSTWRERLVALAAHEACHVRQFREGTRRSEVEAERWALAVLQSWVGGSTVAGDVTPSTPRQLELFALPA
ncbi:MAG: hypothetical protein M3Q23_05375 [Actinomycetota bacterium]|nr:hypothetical protein [Actinomycetota bacterium]